MFQSGFRPRQDIAGLQIPIVDSYVYFDPIHENVNHSNPYEEGGLSNLIASIGIANTTLVISGVNLDLNEYEIVCPENICLKIAKSATINNGTLEVNGPLDIDVRPIGTATLTGNYQYRSIAQVTDIDALKLLTANPNQQIRLLYGTVSGDKLGGIFYYNTTSTTEGDDVDVIQPTDIEVGRWIRSYDKATDLGEDPWDGDIADLNIDGGIDIDRAIEDTDNIVVGIGEGLIRKSAISRIKSYITSMLNAASGLLVRDVKIQDYSEVFYTASMDGTSLTIDFEDGNVQGVIQSADIETFNIVNWPISGECGSLTLILEIGEYAQTWPDNIEWSGGEAPDIAGKSVITFFTHDNGASILGFICGYNFSIV